jgi:hypothetical protein
MHFAILAHYSRMRQSHTNKGKDTNTKKQKNKKLRGKVQRMFLVVSKRVIIICLPRTPLGCATEPVDGSESAGTVYMWHSSAHDA